VCVCVKLNLCFFIIHTVLVYCNVDNLQSRCKSNNLWIHHLVW